MSVSAIQKFLICLGIVISAFLNFSSPVSDNTIVADSLTNDDRRVKLVNVLDFGAKGDGITDDTTALQEAIFYASKNKKTVLLPPTDNYYLITDHIFLIDNTSISGYGATLYMKPQDQPNSMLYSDDDDYVSNIRVEGLRFLSSNTKAGTGVLENSLTSYIDAICFYGVKNLTLKDIRMDNMYGGLKLGDNVYGAVNQNIFIDNLSIFNSRIPVYISSTDNLNMSNSILDAKGGFDQRLHCLYINGDTSNFHFNNVIFKNASGGGIHIYKESDRKQSARNMEFIDCSIEDCKVGAYIWSGAKDIKVMSTTVIRCDLAFYIDNAHEVKINDVIMSDFTKKYDGNKGAFFINKCYESEITKVDIDCSTMGGSLFEIADDINNLLVSSLNAENMKDCDFFYATSKSIKGLIVENSNFEWDLITKPKISFRGAGSEAVFRNNSFFNNSKMIAYLCFNYPGTNITLVNNSLRGLKENLVTR